jgi:hypothetical protein
MDFEELVTALQGPETMKLKHSEVARFINGNGRELLRQLFQAHLKQRALEEAPRTGVEAADGTNLTHVRSRTRTLMTTFGEVEVERLTYGARGRECLAPMDASLNLPPERYSHLVRRHVAEAACEQSFDAAQKRFEDAFGGKIPKRQMLELAHRAAQDFEAFYEAQPTTTATTADLLVLSFDQKGVVMRKESLREATRKAGEVRKHKLDKRISKGEKKNQRRMSQVATVYDLARFPRTAQSVAYDLKPEPGVVRAPKPRPVNKRLWASLERSPVEVILEGFQEALRRDPEKKRRWVVLVDGNADQIDTVKRCAARLDVEITIVLDVIHVLQYLWAAGLSFHDEGTPALEEWVTTRLYRLLDGPCSDVAAGIRRSATKRGLSAEKRAAADKCADYILNHAPYLRFSSYLSEGLPIATGVIEGACRHLVRDRMEVTGARWSLDGAEAILKLRSLRSSGDFDDYWVFHLEREHQRHHQTRYAGGAPPEPTGRPTLRVVKGGASS